MRRLAFAALLAGVIAFTPPAHAAFPGANGKIAYEGCGPVDCGIFTANPDGTGQTQITHSPVVCSGSEGEVSRGTDLSPAWSQDGQKIVYRELMNCAAQTEIAVVNSDGSGHFRVTSNPAGYDEPSWSPDGMKITFTNLGTGGFGDVFVIDIDGSGLTNLTDSPVHDGDPVFSPDGNKIAFSSGEHLTRMEIFVMNPDGNDVDQLTTPNPALPAGRRDPAWSPDGKRIAFSYAESSSICCRFKNDVWVMDADGTDQARVTPADPSKIDEERAEAWSPDNQWIVYSSDFDPFTIQPDGDGKTALPVGKEPDWQPLGALDPYPRPGGATPLRVPLVPAYAQCTAPNSEHAGPLAEPSCSPPAQESSLLTTSSSGRGMGFVRLDVQVGDPGTADEADVAIRVSASDVRNAGSGSDYAGEVIFSTALQITDRANGFGGVSGTVQNLGFSAPVDCTPNGDPDVGSSCTLNTTADTLVPGTVKEGKRAVLATRLIRILDLGPDGLTHASCPPTCSTGDEKPFLVAGVFAP